MKRTATDQAQPSTSKMAQNPNLRTTSSNIDMATINTPDNPRITIPLRIPQTDMPKYKTLEKLTTGLARACHHRRYLQDCADQGNTPKGLMITKEPQIPHVDPTFILEWTLIIEDTHRRLIDCLIKFWASHASFLETEIQKAYTTFSDTTNTEILDHIKNKLNEVKAKEEARLKNRRFQKWGGDSAARNGARGRKPNSRFPTPQQSSTFLNMF